MAVRFRKAYLPRRYHVEIDGRYVGWVYKVNDHRWRAYVDTIISDDAADAAGDAGTIYAEASDRHRSRTDAGAWLARTAPRYLTSETT